MYICDCFLKKTGETGKPVLEDGQMEEAFTGQWKRNLFWRAEGETFTRWRSRKPESNSLISVSNFSWERKQETEMLKNLSKNYICSHKVELLVHSHLFRPRGQHICDNLKLSQKSPTELLDQFHSFQKLYTPCWDFRDVSLWGVRSCLMPFEPHRCTQSCSARKQRDQTNGGGKAAGHPAHSC